MAYTLKKSVGEILALSEWERRIWRDVFDLYGPLDWRRDDLIEAAALQFQSIRRAPLKDFILFADPADRIAAKQTDDDLLKAFGYTGK